MEFGIADVLLFYTALVKRFLTLACRVNLVKSFYSREYAHEYFTKLLEIWRRCVCLFLCSGRPKV